jgi:hypothetical protein
VNGCPNSTQSGCRCPEHDPGLMAFARDPVTYAAALAPCRPAVKLRVVTMPPHAERPCDGTMTCSCQRCIRDRGSRRAEGERPQPWQPRRSRRAA